jgi:hypothetical protein
MVDSSNQFSYIEYSNLVYIKVQNLKMMLKKIA